MTFTDEKGIAWFCQSFFRARCRALTFLPRSAAFQGLPPPTISPPFHFCHDFQSSLYTRGSRAPPAFRGAPVLFFSFSHFYLLRIPHARIVTAHFHVFVSSALHDSSISRRRHHHSRSFTICHSSSSIRPSVHHQSHLLLLLHAPYSFTILYIVISSVETYIPTEVIQLSPNLSLHHHHLVLCHHPYHLLSLLSLRRRQLPMYQLKSRYTSSPFPRPSFASRCSMIHDSSLPHNSKLLELHRKYCILILKRVCPLLP